MKKIISKILILTFLVMPTIGTIANAKSCNSSNSASIILRMHSDPGDPPGVVV